MAAPRWWMAWSLDEPAAASCWSRGYQATSWLLMLSARPLQDRRVLFRDDPNIRDLRNDRLRSNRVRYRIGQSINQSIKNLRWIVQSTAVTVQRKLKIRKRERKEICLQFKCWQRCRRRDFRWKRVPCPWCSCRKSTITNCLDRRVEGTATASDDAELRRRQPGRSVTGCNTKEYESNRAFSNQ